MYSDNIFMNSFALIIVSLYQYVVINVLL